MSRGLRNNNPGNIRLSGVTYKGEVTPSQDKAFKQFQSMAFGYRAMFVVLYTYQKKHGCDTLRQMINRYAPPCENHTDSYIDSVSKGAHLSADSRITTTNKDIMVPVVAAMSRVENGVPAVMKDVEDGWDMFVKTMP